MELWIRSQDKRTLVNTRRIDVDDNKIIIWDEGKYASDVFMGEYATKERALEILDEIQNILNPMIVFKNCNCTKDMLDKIKEVGACVVSDNSHIEQLSTIVYEMPLD